MADFKQVEGTGVALEATEDVTIIAAQGAGNALRITKAVISVTLAATGGGGLVALEDGVGGTRIFEADADLAGVYPLDFGEIGYPLTANTLLNLTVDGAVTNQATARVSVVAIVAP